MASESRWYRERSTEVKGSVGGIAIFLLSYLLKLEIVCELRLGHLFQCRDYSVHV